MRRRLGDILRPALGAFGVAIADPGLRRLSIAWFGTHAGKWAFLVANLVLAYGSGGPVAVGVMGIARFLTPTLIAPFAGLPSARWRPERILLATSAVRALAAAAAIPVVAADAPVEWLYLVVAVEAGAGAFTRPLHMALLPCLARSPGELVAGNVTTSAVEALGTFAGPALAGILLATSGPVWVIVAVLAVYLVALAALAALRVPVVGRADGSLAEVRRQMVAGIGTVVRLRGPRMLVLGIGLQTFVRGLLTVLVVVASIELLGLGEPGVGGLNASMGLGGLIGATIAIALAGRSRLAPPFAIALASWGAPIAVIGLLADPLAAIVAMAVVGMSNALLDVAGFTLLQRTTPRDARVAVLGLVDGVANGTVAVGGVVAPVLVEALGVRGALVVSGAILPIAAAVMWPGLRRVDEDAVDAGPAVDRFRGVQMFAPLPLATVEYLATSAEPAAFADGQWLMREGERGDRYYLLDAGQAEVSQGGRQVRVVGPGEGVGEIALLRDIPRTASVRATGPVRAYALERDDFLQAITGQPASLTAAATLVDDRLATEPRPTSHAGDASADLPDPEPPTDGRGADLH